MCSRDNGTPFEPQLDTTYTDGVGTEALGSDLRTFSIKLIVSQYWLEVGRERFQSVNTSDAHRGARGKNMPSEPEKVAHTFDTAASTGYDMKQMESVEAKQCNVDSTSNGVGISTQQWFLYHSSPPGS